MLPDRYSLDDLTTLLLPRNAWHPYPVADDRDAWTSLPEDLRMAYLARGEGLLDYVWPTLPATLFLEFVRMGNRSNYQSVRYQRRHALRDLVLAECVEGDGRFLDDIVNGIWTTCEETYWGVPAHINMQRAGVDLPDVEEPTVDLFAAETSALLAWTTYLLGERLDTVSPLVRRRIRYETKRRVLDPCLARDDFWWMSFAASAHGINNWNPWINSNWLATTLLLEEDSGRRAAAVHKILRSLDLFLDIYAESGGCDEGPGYWGRAAASLFDCLDQLYSVTEGELDVYDEAKIKNMGRYIYRAHIADHYFVNFADASAIGHPPASLVYRYGRAIDDRDMMGFGAWLMGEHAGARGKQEGSLGRILPAIFDVPDEPDVAPAQPLSRAAWFYGVEVMVARDQAGSPEGFFVAAKGGHNNESHNHNDVGNVIVYVGGKPVIVDAGVETYRRKTFSPQRYEIWTMQSAYHTLLPTFEVDGEVVMQAPGEAFAARGVAYRESDTEAHFILDIAGAYPPEANVQSWGRTITLQRGKALVIEDTFALAEPVQAISVSLLTPCEVAVEDGELDFKPSAFGPEGIERETGAARMTFAPGTFDVTVERVTIDDARLGSVWGDGLNRVVFRAASPPRQGTWTWRLTL